MAESTSSSSSRKLPADYIQWLNHARRLLLPLAALMEPGRAQIPITGLPSDHDANADRLETFARPALLAALWLQAQDDPAPPDDGLSKEYIAQWFRQGLVAGSDSNNRDYWGPCANFHQNGVEMGLLAVALQIGEKWLWSPLSDSEKKLVGHWLGSIRGSGHVWNNHMYFGIFVLEFLRHAGLEEPGDQTAIDYLFSELETMYRGQGWFMDGTNEASDHYNAYSWNYYGLIWSYLHGHTNPERSKLWSGWAGEFLAGYHHFFAANGEHPAFGRSITYRFNTTAPFSLAHLMNVLPISPGQARRLCTRNLEFFLNKPIFQSQGCLSLGWLDEFHDMIEPYSCAGSPYWAVKAFSTLLIPPEDSFWTEQEEPLASEKGDFAHPMKCPGLLIRGCGGEVEILNAGSQISPTNLDRYGPWKWGKFSYRTGFGFQIGQDRHHYPPDSALTARQPGGEEVYGRHATLPLAVEPDHIFSDYALGDKFKQFHISVKSYLWWCKGWLLQLHYYNPYQPSELMLGSYSLSSTDPEVFFVNADFPYATAWNDTQGVALQNLCGFEKTSYDARVTDDTPRRNIQAPYHTTLILSKKIVQEPGILSALTWAGTDRAEAAPWKAISTDNGKWEFEHPLLGEWIVENPVLPELPVQL